MWTRFFGRIRARVGNEQRFISKDPSPSRAITFRWGKPSAMPRAMEGQSPKVRTRKLPSPGRRAFHSKVTVPAEVTTRSSPPATPTLVKQSNLFRGAARFKLAHRRLESTGTSAKLGAQVILSSTTAPPDAWNPQPEFVLA